MQSRLSAIDLFAGAGGFGLGLSMAGFNIPLALEIDDWATDTLYANNDKDLIILQDDIRAFNNLEGIAKLFPQNLDLIIGGPPCQGFSISGPVKDPNDPRNSLFIEFARWVGYFQPKMFVMENVTGLLIRKNKEGEKVIDIIKRKFSEIGYHTTIWNLNSANYGVPQLRERIFIVGSKSENNIPPPIPTHYISNSDKKKYKNLQKAITVANAISDLPKLNSGEGEEIMSYTKKPQSIFQEWARTNSFIVHNHVAMKHSRRIIDRYKSIINGTKFAELPEELLVRKRNGNGVASDVVYNQNYRHIKPNLLSPTIPASFYSNFIHPSLPRNITSREAARLQSFPDTYIFKGKRTQISSNLLKRQGREAEDNLSQYNQIGNAVPPLLAKAIGDQIKLIL